MYNGVRLTRSEPAKSTKWNFDTIVIQSPLSSCSGGAAILSRLSGGRRPKELAGLAPPLDAIPDVKLGVEGRPNAGELRPADGCCIIEPGLVRRDGERPPGGSGDDERVDGGPPDPVYFFCVSVNENIA